MTDHFCGAVLPPSVIVLLHQNVASCQFPAIQPHTTFVFPIYFHSYYVMIKRNKLESKVIKQKLNIVQNNGHLSCLDDRHGKSSQDTGLN